MNTPIPPLAAMEFNREMFESIYPVSPDSLKYNLETAQYEFKDSEVDVALYGKELDRLNLVWSSWRCSLAVAASQNSTYINTLANRVEVLEKELDYHKRLLNDGDLTNVKAKSSPETRVELAKFELSREAAKRGGEHKS